MENTNLAYLAGLIDGDGSFVLRGHPRYEVRLRIRTTSEPTTRWLQANFGGSCHREKDRDGKKPYWAWEIGSYAELIALLERCLPYLIKKQGRAVDVLEFARIAKNTPPRFETRREAWSDLKKLEPTP